MDHFGRFCDVDHVLVFTFQHHHCHSRAASVVPATILADDEVLFYTVIFPGDFKISTLRMCILPQTSKSLHVFLMFSGISEHRFSVCLLFGTNDLQMSGSWAQSCLQEQSERLHMRVETKRFGSTP